MLHHDKEEFIRILERTSAQTGFTLRLLEKDYYISIILSQINSGLNNSLIFKGGTCLNKIYYSYYRLSEDLDFSLKLPSDSTTRQARRKLMKPIKESLKSFTAKFDMNVENIEKAGHNESTQYVYYLTYHSVVLNKKDSVKLEIGLRFNPLLPVEKRRITHKFLHPFTGEPLFDAGKVTCLSIKELVSEKMRAAATRAIIAPRDFYDLGYLLRAGFDFTDREFLKVFKRKLEEDGFSADLGKYRNNLGRTQKEINDMKSGLKDQLFPVLTMKEQESFDIQKVLNKFNKIFGENGSFLQGVTAETKS